MCSLLWIMVNHQIDQTGHSISILKSVGYKVPVKRKCLDRLVVHLLNIPTLTLTLNYIDILRKIFRNRISFIIPMQCLCLCSVHCTSCYLLNLRTQPAIQPRDLSLSSCHGTSQTSSVPHPLRTSLCSAPASVWIPWKLLRRLPR